ncbi:MAG TPA: translocation/assembly module TamB domain-containing protein [Burkholderiales bacterium]|nr:translocation/assembly module TamB domain-containing protein [Burkholderiales bacterium]
MAVLLVAAAVALGWLFATDAGLRWVLARAEREMGGALVIEGGRGTLISVVTIKHVRFEADGTRVEARDVSTHANLAAAFGGQLRLEPLHIASLDIAIGEGGSRASPPPALPFGLRLGNVEVERLRVLRGEATYSLRKVRFKQLALAQIPPGVSADGTFELEDEKFPMSGSIALGGTLERLEAKLALRQGDIVANANAVLAPFRPQHLVSLDATVSPIDLARFGDELPQAALSLTVKATGTDRGLQGTFVLANRAPGPLDQHHLPIAQVEARVASGDLETATLEDLRIALAGGGVLEGRGRYDAKGFQGSFKASRLNLRGLRSTLRQTQLSGPLDVALTHESQTVRGTLSQEGMSLSAEAVRRGDTVEIRALRAAAAGGEVTGAGTVRLTDPIAFNANLQLARFNPAAFGDYPAGSISGSVLADGDLADEPRVQLQWSIAKSTLLDGPLESRGSANLVGRRVLKADAQASLGESHATVRGGFGTSADKLAWTLDVPSLEDYVEDLAGSMKASGTLSGTWSVPEVVAAAELEKLELPHDFRAAGAKVNVSGTLGRHEGRLTLRTDGGAELETHLRGGYANGAWSGEVLSLEGHGQVPMHLRAPTSLRIAKSRVELGRVDATLGDGHLLVNDLAWSKDRVISSGEFKGLPAQWAIAAAGLTDRLKSTLMLDGQWSVTAAPALDGNLRLRRASGDLVIQDERPIALGLQSVALDARFTPAGVGMRLDIISSYATGAIAGQVSRDPAGGPLGLGKGSPLNMQAQLELAHAKVLAQPVGTDARFDGRLIATVEASGTVGTPVFNGSVRGDAITFDYPPYGVYLKNGELRARLEGDRLRVERFSIQAGEGTFTANGTLPLRLTEGEANLMWQAKNFAVLERPDMRLVATGQGEAGFDGKRLLIAGELHAERGHLEIERDRIPKLGEDVVIVGQPRKPEAAKGALPVHLNIDLDLGSNFTIHAQGLEGKLTGRINFTTTAEGELRAYGRIETLNATYFAYGQRLQVAPGIMIFDGALDNPALQITAWRRNQAVEAGVQLSGTMLAPRVQIVSQPPVSEGERLSWLVLGRAPTDATKADLGLLQAAAGALLARGDSMPIDRKLAKTFGLDEISFRGTGEVQDRAIAVGKRLSDKVYVSYEQGLGTVTSSLVKLDYALSRRWSLRAETGTSSGWGVFYRFSWD